MPHVSNRRYQEGFSLAELIIVLLVVGILVALTLSRMSLHRVRAMNSACNGIMAMVKRAADAYYADAGATLLTVDELVGTGYLEGHPRDPHDSHKQYQVLDWDGVQVRVECPNSTPQARIIFPPGHVLN